MNVSRYQARRRLYDIIRRSGDLATVQVSYAWPRVGLENRAVWLGQITGNVDYPTMSAGRKRREDTFTVEVFVWANVPGDDDGADSDDACNTLLGVIESLIADNLLLPLEGVNLSGLLSGKVVGMDGPTPLPSDEGFGSTGRIEVQFVMSYT